MPPKETSKPLAKHGLPTGEGCFHDAIVFKVGTGGNAIQLSSVFIENNVYQQFLSPDQYFIVAKFKGDQSESKPAISLFSCAATAKGFPFNGTTNIYFSGGIIAMAITTAKSISHNREYPCAPQKGPLFSLVRSKNNSKTSLKNEDLFSQLKNKDLFNSLEPVDSTFFDSEEWNSIKVQLLKSATLSDSIKEKKKITPTVSSISRPIISSSESSPSDLSIRKEIEEAENKLNLLKKKLELQKKATEQKKDDSPPSLPPTKIPLTLKDVVVIAQPKEKVSEKPRSDSRASEKAWSDYDDDEE
jgi:hypothetical protein